MGVTGQREQTSSAAPTLVERVRAVTDKPVGVGLGVSNRAQAAEVASTPMRSSSARPSCGACSTRRQHERRRRRAESGSRAACRGGAMTSSGRARSRARRPACGTSVPSPCAPTRFGIIIGALLALWIGEKRFTAPRRPARLHRRRRDLGHPVRHRRRPHLPRRHRPRALLRRRAATADRRAVHLGGRPRHLGRHRRAERSVPGSPAAATTSVRRRGRRARARPARRAGRRTPRQLRQPGAVRQAHRPALGAGDRRRSPSARLRAVRDVPPDVPVRDALEPRGRRPARR